MNISDLHKVMYINCSDKGFYKTIIILEPKNGIIHYFKEKADFISFYSHIAKELIDGKTLYIDSNCGYVGIMKSEGPYSEEQVFESEYEGQNIDFNELLINLNENIKKEKKVQRKLNKIGVRYK